MNKYWHNDQWIDNNIVKTEEFNYEKHIKELKIFEQEHPQVMKKRIEQKNWKFDFDISRNKTNFKDIAKNIAEKYFNLQIGYKNYKIVKK